MPRLRHDSLILSLPLTLLPLAGLAGTAELTRALEGLGLEAQWRAEAPAPAGVELSGVTLRGPRALLRAEAMSWDQETGGLHLSAGSVVSAHPHSGSSSIDFSRMSASGPEALAFLGEFRPCEATPEDAIPGRLVQDRVTIRGSRDLPGGIHSVERLDVASMETGFLVSGSASCFLVPEFGARGVVAMGADRSRAHVGEIAFRASDLHGWSGDLQARLGDVAFFGPDGVWNGGIAALSLDMAADIPAPLSLDGEGVVDALINGSSSVRIEVRDADFRVRDILSGSVPDPAVAPEVSRVNLRILVSHEGERVEVDLDGRASGLAAASLGMDLRLIRSDAVAGLGQLLGAGRADVDLLERIAIAGAELRLENLGSVAILESLTGRSADAILAGISARLRPFPSEIGAVVMEFAERSLSGPAVLKMSPDDVLSFPRIAMTGMMRPGRLVSLLGLEVR